MKALITTESRYLRTPDGQVWTLIGPDYSIWRRYLTTFSHVMLAARIMDVPEVPLGATAVTGDRVSVLRLPYYIGLRQGLRSWRTVRRSVGRAALNADAVILRVPSAVATLCAQQMDRLRVPFLVEAIGDPHQVFARGVVSHPLRPVLRRWYTRAMQHQCRSAAAVLYETERALQNRYPASPCAITAGISSVSLPGEAFADRPRPTGATHRPPVLMSIGTLEQPYKGIDVLVRAVYLLATAGIDVRLIHVGIGQFHSQLQRLAERLGVAHQVTFAGWLPSVDALRRQLDAADLFVMPSRTEGLPRALIEAMARGLPAVATAVGGIPELLPDDYLIPPGDAAQLAKKIEEMLRDPSRRAEASIRNLEKAREYAEERLAPRRAGYYQRARQILEGSVVPSRQSAQERDVESAPRRSQPSVFSTAANLAAYQPGLTVPADKTGADR